jgi:hypothetical protein
MKPLPGYTTAVVMVPVRVHISDDTGKVAAYEHPAMPDVEERYNASLRDPRHPRRDHYIEVSICRGEMTVAAATAYASRCGITVGQILQDHGCQEEDNETAHTD